MGNGIEKLSVSKLFSGLRVPPNHLTQVVGGIYDKKLPEKIAVYVLDHFEKFLSQIKKISLKNSPIVKDPYVQ